MYFDVMFREYVDENGVKCTETIPVTVAPEYPDITPADMSTTNQLKAGGQLNQVTARNGSKLGQSDAATQSLFENGSRISDPVPTTEPSPEPSPEPKTE